MSVLQFEDLTNYDGQSGYVCPNEDVSIWRDFVKGRRIDRAGAICSGGEVGFFALLPTVRQELALIDHSYASLSYAMLKYMILCERGWKDTQRLFSSSSHRTELEAIITALLDRLPASVLGGSDHLDYSYTKGRVGVRLTGGSSVMRQMWSEVTPSVASSFYSKLGKVRFIHGDMKALAGYEPFDLFYMSNAHDGGNGNRSMPMLEDIQRALKPGGLVLSTHIPAGQKPDGWTLLDSRRTGSNYVGGSWIYELHQVPAAT